MKNLIWMLLSSLGLAAGLCGCASGPRPWNYEITKTTPASIQVDLIGVSASDEVYWQGYNLDKYWTEGDRRRAEADKITQTLQRGTPWLVNVDDPAWQRWLNHGCTEVLMIANLPGSFDPGPADPRRIFLPLQKSAWKARHQTIEIQVQDSIILVLTQRKTP